MIKQPNVDNKNKGTRERISFCCIHDTSYKHLQWKECDKELVPAQVDTDGNRGGCGHKQDVWDGSQRGKHGVLSYVGLSECLCERGRAGE